MRYLLLIVAIALGLTAFSQTPRPATLPSPNSTGYAKWGYVRGDSAFLLGLRGDTTWVPITSALSAVKFAGRDTSILYFYDGVKWKPAGAGGGGGSTVDSFFYQLRQLNDTTVLFDRGDGVVDTLAISGGSGGGGSGLNKVDSVTTVGDSLFYWINGDSFFSANLALSVVNGDTSSLSTVDSTGQPARRVLFSAPNNKISSTKFFLYDTVNNKLVIGTPIISAGTGSKLFVNGNASFQGNVIADTGYFNRVGLVARTITFNSDSMRVNGLVPITDTGQFKPMVYDAINNTWSYRSSWPSAGSAFPTIGNGLKLDGGVLRWADTLQDGASIELNGRTFSLTESMSGNFLYVGDDIVNMGSSGADIALNPSTQEGSISAQTFNILSDSLRITKRLAVGAYSPTTTSTFKYKVVLMDSTTGALVTTNPSSIGSDTAGTGSLYIRNQSATQEAKTFNIRSGRLDSLYASGSGGIHFATNSGASAFEYGGGGGTQVTFNGFAGYNANRAASYTARSFTDKNYVDSTVAAVPTVTSYGKNAGGDSTILLLSNGQRFAAKDSTGAGGGSGVTTVGTFSGSSQTNGASISGSTITFGPADATSPGMVSTGAQTWGGAKTFNDVVTTTLATGANVNVGTASIYLRNEGAGTRIGVGKQLFSMHHFVPNDASASFRWYFAGDFNNAATDAMTLTPTRLSLGASVDLTLSNVLRTAGAQSNVSQASIYLRDNTGSGNRIGIGRGVADVHFFGINDYGFRWYGGGDFNTGASNWAYLDQNGMALYGSNAASAALTINSTTKGLLLPRMSATQGSAIASPADGLMIYVTTTNATFTSVGFWGRENGAWVKL